MTIDELVTARATAGAEYAAATAAWRRAYVELAALDRVLSNSHHAAPGFGEMPEPVMLRHAMYLPDENGHFGDDVRARVETIMQTQSA